MFTSSKASSSGLEEEGLPSYDEIFGADPHAAALLRSTNSLELQFQYASWTTNNITVVNPSGEIRYYAEFCETANTPDVILRKGSKDGTVLGTSHIPPKRDIDMYLGDGGTNSVMRGTKATMVTKDQVTFAKHILTIPRGNDRRVVDLIRTSNKEDGVKGAAGRMAYYNYKIVDHDTGRWLGVWLENGQVNSKKGKLRIQVAGDGPDAKPVLTEDEVNWIVLAMVSMAEKMRRRASPYSGVAGALARWF